MVMTLPHTKTPLYGLGWSTRATATDAQEARSGVQYFHREGHKERSDGARKERRTVPESRKMDDNTVIDGPVATDAFGATAFFQDCEGNLLMLWQAV